MFWAQNTEISLATNEIAQQPMKRMMFDNIVVVMNTFISVSCVGLYSWTMVSIAAVQTLKYKSHFTKTLLIVYWIFSYILSRRKADQLKEQICASKDINSAETLAYQQQLRVFTAVATTRAEYVFIYVWFCSFRSSTNKCWH